MKHTLGKLFQAAKSTVASTLHNLDPNCTSPILPVSSSSEKPNFEGITLIWYDSRVDKTKDTKITAEELREINDCVLFYSNQDECINYMRSVENEKIFLITSGKEATVILPEIKFNS